MNTFTTMADQLSRASTPPITESDSKAGRMRAELRANGPSKARHLAEVANVTGTARVSAILKWDIQQGRVQLHDGVYSWNTNYVEPTSRNEHHGLREVLDWHEVASNDLPDADLTVIVRLRNNEEPVWLGYCDGHDWRDLDGQPVDVVRWADMPLGGEA